MVLDAIQTVPRYVYRSMKARDTIQTDTTWLLRLRAAVQAGYYRTESAVGEQERFPWQGKTCGDCPFWRKGKCLVRLTPRDASAPTCSYFDEPNRGAARAIIARRRHDQWWDDFYRNSSTP